jgi:hypothetical protein
MGEHLFPNLTHHILYDDTALPGRSPWEGCSTGRFIDPIVHSRRGGVPTADPATKPPRSESTD